MTPSLGAPVTFFITIVEGTVHDADAVALGPLVPALFVALTRNSHVVTAVHVTTFFFVLPAVTYGPNAPPSSAVANVYEIAWPAVFAGAVHETVICPVFGPAMAATPSGWVGGTNACAGSTTITSESATMTAP